MPVPTAAADCPPGEPSRLAAGSSSDHRADSQTGHLPQPRITSAVAVQVALRPSRASHKPGFEAKKRTRRPRRPGGSSRRRRGGRRILGGGMREVFACIVVAPINNRPNKRIVRWCPVVLANRILAASCHRRHVQEFIVEQARLGRSRLAAASSRLSSSCTRRGPYLISAVVHALYRRQSPSSPWSWSSHLYKLVKSSPAGQPSTNRCMRPDDRLQRAARHVDGGGEDECD